MKDFDATLYFLDEKELDYLRRETKRVSHDLRKRDRDLIVSTRRRHTPAAKTQRDLET